ncbi:MAG: ribosomal protein [Candidatus Doudnabacteria bacterium]|nr:ribosomal protein [Candidatus Doudnabacteria bacterium]
MKFTIAKKLNMSSHFLETGTVVPVTILQVGPAVVTQVKTKEKDKYEAVQVGYGAKKSVSKALAGHYKGLGKFAMVKEFKMKDMSGVTVGQKLDLTDFQIGEMIDVTGIMKGRGFAGAIKRHGFHGMPASHGHDKPRAVGSIGQRFPQHVRKGLRMAGRMGGVGVTVKNLQIVDIDLTRNLISVKGAVPGHRNGLVQVVSTGKVKDLELKRIDKKEKKK